MRPSRRVLIMGLMMLPPAAQAQPPLNPFGQLPHGSPPKSLVVRPHGMPKGWVMLIHGGGFQTVGPDQQRQQLPYARWLASQGYAVDVTDYHPGKAALSDTIASYDRIRRMHPNARIFADGSSAGGTLALDLAAARKLSAVFSEGGITDMRDFSRNPHPAVAAGTPSYVPNAWPATRKALMDQYLTPSFGKELWRYSPDRVAKHIKVPVLAAGSSYDWIVPQKQQLADLSRVLAGARTMLLQGAPTPAGEIPNFTHASVTQEALDRFRRVMLRTMARAR